MMNCKDKDTTKAHLETSPASLTVCSAAERLDCWKDIAAFFNRCVRTVQRWEVFEGMPVRRHRHDAGGSVYAWRQELDAWRGSRGQLKRIRATSSVIQRMPVLSLPLDQQAALRTVLESILQQLGETGARTTGAIAPDEALGQSASEQAMAATQDSRITGDNTNGNRIPPRTFLPELQ